MSTLPNIFPAAKAAPFQNGTVAALPEKNGGSGGQFADWMSRALSSTPEAGASNILPAANPDLSLNKDVSGLSEKSGDNKDLLDDVTTDASSLIAAGKSLVTVGTPVAVAPPIVADLQTAIPVSGTLISPVSKKSKSDAKISDSGYSKTVEDQPVTNPPPLPENVNVAVNPEISLMPNLVPSLTLAGSSGKIPAGNGTVFQPAQPVSKSNSSATGKAVDMAPQSLSQPAASLNVSAPVDPKALDIAPAISAAAEIAAVFPESENIPATPAKISDTDFSQNQPGTEAVSKIQTGSQKKTAPTVTKANALTPETAVAPKAGALTPVTPPIPSVAAAVNLKAPEMLKTDAEMAADFSSPEFSGLLVPDGKTVVPPAASADGTSAAKQDELLGGAEKPSKSVSLSGKILPSGGTLAVRGNDLPSRVEQIFTTATAGTAAQNNSATVTVSAATPVENPLAEDVRAQALERAHDAIALHAMSLTSAGTDSLQVVIKPGAGTQLSLELRQRGDGVEALAVLQQGDFKHLNQQWPELQQRLEQRGIKLAVLTVDGTFANGGNGETLQQRKNQPENQPAGALAKMTFAATVTGVFTKPMTRAVAQAGWETWA